MNGTHFFNASILNEESLEKLYNYCAKYPGWGSSIWCCMQRKTKPQAAVVKKMKEAKEWPAELDELKENLYDKHLRERYTELALARKT